MGAMVGGKRRRELVEWFGGQVLLPTYVHEGGAPFRPGGSLWCSTDARQIVGWSPFERDGSLAAVVEHFLLCTRQPWVGAPRMPDRVRVPTRELAEALRYVVPRGVQIVCAPTPEIDEVVHDMVAHLETRPPAEGEETYFAPDIDADLLARAFAGAARFFRAQPWKLLDGATLIGVDSAELGLKGAVLACMGHDDGAPPGLIFFESFADFEANIRSMDGADGHEPRLRKQLILDFDRGAEVPPSMRKEVAAHQWEVASALAYPWVSAVDDDSVQRPGTRAELALMTDLAEAVADLLERDKRLARRLAKGEPIVHVCKLDHAQVLLRLPFEDERVLELNQHLVDDLLDNYPDSPECSALGRPPAWAHLVPELAIQEGFALEELSPKIIKALIFEVVPARIAVHPSDALEILEEARAMIRYLHRHDVIGDLEPSLAVVGLKRAPALEKVLADETRWERSKQILVAGTRAGFDMSTEQGIVAYLRSLEPAPKKKRTPKKKS